MAGREVAKVEPRRRGLVHAAAVREAFAELEPGRARGKLVVTLP